MEKGTAVVLDEAALDELIDELSLLGYAVDGPVIADGAVKRGRVSSLKDMPRGWRDEQAPGHYRLFREEGGGLFHWAVGPSSLKAELFPARATQWTGRAETGTVSLREDPHCYEEPRAILGARPCDVAALGVLDGVLARGRVADRRYASRRESLFIIVVECGHPASTCFCTSIGTGPSAEAGFDLALTELEGGENRFLARAGSEGGLDVLSRLTATAATEADLRARDEVIARSKASIGRHIDSRQARELLAERIDHPRWTEVAERCLACGNCTLVCPTCFCCDITDVSDLDGGLVRERRWASCFDVDHSYLHGGPVRRSVSSRYRQWATHKFSTWWDQFGTSGCVGCGRCITWCPVGIDVTEEIQAVCARGEAEEGGVETKDGGGVG